MQITSALELLSLDRYFSQIPLPKCYICLMFYFAFFTLTSLNPAKSFELFTILPNATYFSNLKTRRVPM
jgi:hypothetical protein